MKYEDFYRQMDFCERKASHKNDLIAEDFIKKHLEKICENELSYKSGSSMDALLYEYFKIKGTEKEIIFQNLLDSYNFNYSMSIHNSIYYLLATQREFTDKIDPLAWPGVYDISVLE